MRAVVSAAPRGLAPRGLLARCERGRPALALQLSTNAKKDEKVTIAFDAAKPAAADAPQEKAKPKVNMTRRDEMFFAAEKVQGGKSTWQKLVGGTVDALRPITKALHSTVQPMLDAPSRRRVREAVNIEDLRVAAEKRAHAMVYVPRQRARDGVGALPIIHSVLSLIHI